MDNEIRIKTRVPPEIVEDPMYQKFLEEIESFKGQLLDETTEAEINNLAKEFEAYMKENYPEHDDIKCKVMDSYHVVAWTLHDILEAYKQEYPERYVDKDEYTRIEVNNMLFDLEIADVIGDYENVVYPFSSDESKNKAWDSIVSVRARY